MASIFFSSITLTAAITFIAAPVHSDRSWATSVNRWPSVVQVELKNLPGSWVHSCSGAILRSTYVLSAAQCFSGSIYNPRNRRIRAGSAHSRGGGTLHNVVLAYNHPSYGYHQMDGDIAVVKLKEPLIYSNTIQQGRFITHGTRVPDNLSVKSVGWNYVWETYLHPTLLQTEITTVNNGVCATRYLASSRPLGVTENMICAGATYNNNTFCQGGPGSPLYYEDPTQGDIIVGLFSFNKGCDINNLPGVYTAVSSYINWVIASAI